jgi:hypothetical protein
MSVRSPGERNAGPFDSRLKLFQRANHTRVDYSEGSLRMTELLLPERVAGIFAMLGLSTTEPLARSRT